MSEALPADLLHRRVRAEKNSIQLRALADLNGFAGGTAFGSGCSEPRENPVTYPFESVGGDVQFTQPKLGERTLDFNTEGMVHIGLVPELIEDAKIGGASDADLDLARSAEAIFVCGKRLSTDR